MGYWKCSEREKRKADFVDSTLKEDILERGVREKAESMNTATFF